MRNTPRGYCNKSCIRSQVDKLMALRKQINEALAAAGGAKLSVNDFIVKASALVRMICENDAGLLAGVYPRILVFLSHKCTLESTACS